MNRVVNALFNLQKKVGTRRRRAPDGVVKEHIFSKENLGQNYGQQSALR